MTGTGTITQFGHSVVNTTGHLGLDMRTSAIIGIVTTCTVGLVGGIAVWHRFAVTGMTPVAGHRTAMVTGIVGAGMTERNSRKGDGTVTGITLPIGAKVAIRFPLCAHTVTFAATAGDIAVIESRRRFPRGIEVTNTAISGSTDMPLWFTDYVDVVMTTGTVARIYRMIKPGRRLPGGAGVALLTLIATIKMARNFLMALIATTSDIGMIEGRRTPGVGGMTGIAVTGGGNMVTPLTARSDSVMTVGAWATDIIMIHIGRRP